jgi:hypothetical protein
MRKIVIAKTKKGDTLFTRGILEKTEQKPRTIKVIKSDLK